MAPLSKDEVRKKLDLALKCFGAWLSFYYNRSQGMGERNGEEILAEIENCKNILASHHKEMLLQDAWSKEARLRASGNVP
eukprot:14257460-Ditylum_brightwellii.AAC.1